MTKNKLYSFCMLNLSRTFLLNVLAASYVAFCFTLAVVLAGRIKREYSVAILQIDFADIIVNKKLLA